MKKWLGARSGRQLLMLYWTTTLAVGLLGATTWFLLFGGGQSFTLHLAFPVAGTFLGAVCGTCGALARRRRERCGD